MTMNRREFVAAAGGLLGGGAASLVAGCASLVATPVTPVDGVIRLAVRNHRALAQAGGGLKLDPRGGATPVYVLVQPDGSFLALSPVCTHLQCIVSLGRDALVCPCHGSTYDRTGRVLRGPAEQPLRRYPTALSPDGTLTISLEDAA